ncbi:glycosyltransferase [Clostridium sp.]|uniref:glycosyltransferase n=1 Tax=Clostridium sp. TaxID=1506 RepID=UPI001DA0ECBE|nr:glycosyltransferase [Clostridium sp.]MBS5938018.1 glycosyltransferase [Clostridium sp.]
MHVLIIPSAYPTEEFPLSSIFYKEQALAIKEQGNKVGVIFSETRRVSRISYNMLTKNHFQIGKYNEDGLITYRLHGWNILTMRGPAGINLWVKQSLKLFEKYIASEGLPDIIHVHSALYGGLAAIQIKNKYNIPFVITEHSSGVLQGELREHDIPMLKDVYNNADYIISVGEKLKEVIGTYSNRRVEVIPNIVDVERFSINRSKEDDNFTFISISHLKENKNIDLTLKALKEVIKVYDNIRLIVVGDGPEKESLINIAKELMIDTKIDFIGAVSRENLNNIINKADAFVLPSKYETFGIAYIEALACGLPIITSKCGGPEDFFNENIGVMIPKCTVDELSNAMINIIENFNKFNSNYLREYVKDRFSKEVIAKSVLDVYNHVLNENGDINE